MSKIDRETAENEFQRWCERARIDTEFDASTEDGQARATAKNRIVKEIENGSFVVDDDGIGSIVADVKGTQVEVPFRNFYNGAHVAMDRKKDGQNFGKMNASLSALTGHPDVTFATMHPADIKICQAVILLFLV